MRLIAVIHSKMILMIALIAAIYLFLGGNGIDEIGLAPAAPELGLEVNRSQGFARRSRTLTENIN